MSVIYQAKVVNAGRDRRPGPYFSEDHDGFNGRFYLVINNVPLCLIASDGEDWEHVSVSIAGSKLPPSWAVMCRVKELFWGPELWVVQYHPPEKDNINQHPGCLHLWRPVKGDFPKPDPRLVGYSVAPV